MAPLRHRTFVLALAASCLVATAPSCGGSDDVRIDSSPTTPPPGSGDPANPPQDGTSDTGAGGAGGEANTGPGAARVSCPPLSDTPDSGARFAVAMRSTKAKTLDGDFSDFGGCESVVVDALTAARVKGTPAASAKIMIEWDPSALWIAAEVTDAQLEGTDGALPYLNDSLELYVSSAGLRTGDYGPNDHQFVVDYRGLAVAYPAGTPTAPKATVFTSAVAGGYHIEMRVDAVFAFGARLSKGDVRFFDAMINDGTAQSQFLVWAMQPHASCSCVKCVCNRSPALDTLLFAPLTLQ